MKLKEFSLLELFEVHRGSGRYTKSFVQSHCGDYALYSGNTAGKFASIDNCDYTTPCLSWVIDGLAGYMMVHNELFSATNHRGVLVPKVANIDLQYVKSILEPMFRALKKGRQGDNGVNEYTSLPPFMIKSINIIMPIDKHGEIDLLAQNSISEKHILSRQIQSLIEEKRKGISGVNVVLDDDSYRVEYYPLPMIFSTTKGNSKYTKKYGNSHAGEHPVYSASSHTPLTYIDTYDYDGRYITWSTNGFAGTILILDEKFSINGDRGILVPKDGRIDIDFDYMKHILEPIFRELSKGRKGDNGEDEFTKLYPSMLADVMIPIPVNQHGDICIVAQKEIASKYLAVEKCKQEIIDRLDKLVCQKISIQPE